MNVSLKSAPVTEQPAAANTTPTKTAPRRPLLGDVVDAIRADAMHDSLKYVLRSNTGHDGE